MATRVTVLTGIFPPDIGGPATSVPELVRWLAADGWDPTVVTLADTTDARADEVPVVRIPRGTPWPLRALGIGRAVRASRPEIIFANGLHLESTLLGKVPVVQKIVGDWAWERARNQNWTDVGIDDFERAHVGTRVRALRALRGAVTRRAQRVIVPSRHLAGLVQSWGIAADRVRVVPNAAPQLDPAPRGDPRRGVFVGRLVSWKNVDHAIQALSGLPHLTLDIVGAGPELEPLRTFVRSLGLTKRVVFHGALPREETLAMLSGAGFLILPSSYEGMPHVVLEAFALGVPVVASDAPGIRELIEDHVSGLLYRWGDLEELENSLRLVSDSTLASGLARAGRVAAAHLSPDASAAATSRALREALR